MKLGWKCGFCSEFNTQKLEMEKHEASCCFSAAAKRCFTCKHSAEDGAPISGYWTVCNLGLDVESDEKCNGWEGLKK